MPKRRDNFLCFFIVFIMFIFSFFFWGCATKEIRNDTVSPSPPVLSVNTPSLSLGVAKLLKTDIVFTGSGFPAGDSIFVTIVGADNKEIAIANGKVQADGTFEIAASSLDKITGILNASVSGNYAKDGSYEQFVVLTKPAIPAGEYTARATGMLFDKRADAKIKFNKPSYADRLKDWLGIKLGKIKDNRSI